MTKAAQLKLAVADLAAAMLQAHAAAAEAAAGQAAGTGFGSRAAAALPLLLAAYGATMSTTDRALLAAIRTIDHLAASETGSSPLAAAG